MEVAGFEGPRCWVLYRHLLRRYIFKDFFLSICIKKVLLTSWVQKMEHQELLSGAIFKPPRIWSMKAKNMVKGMINTT